MNEVLLSLIIIAIFAFIILYFKGAAKVKNTVMDYEEDRYSIESILSYIKGAFNEILKPICMI